MASPGGKKGLLGSDLAGDVIVKDMHPSDAVMGYFDGSLTACEHSTQLPVCTHRKHHAQDGEYPSKLCSQAC